MTEVKTITLKSDEKPTIEIQAVQVVKHQYMPSERWCIYKIRRGEGCLFLVVEVFSRKPEEELNADEYQEYHRVVSEPINERGLIGLLGIEHSDERETLETLGIDWEEKTRIRYGFVD